MLLRRANKPSRRRKRGRPDEGDEEGAGADQQQEQQQQQQVDQAYQQQQALAGAQNPLPSGIAGLLNGQPANVVVASTRVSTTAQCQYVSRAFCLAESSMCTHVTFKAPRHKSYRCIALPRL